MKRPISESDAERRYVSTAQVADALGVSVTTVKRWVDDGILPAVKTVGGHRKLLLSDVIRLARSGALPQADLSRLDPSLSADEPPDAELLSARLTAALRQGDGDSISALLTGAYKSGSPIEWLADQVISPAMAQIGHEWSTGEIGVMHEHRGTQLIAAALYELKLLVDANAERDRPVAFGGAIEGDHYLLPSLLAQMALTDNGWKAVNLGPNTPMESFTQALRELKPRLAWLSVSYLPDADVFRNEYGEFYHEAQSRGVPVAVGGRALPDEVRSAIPYTTFGDGLTHLVAFAQSIHPRPRPPRRGRPPGR